jgi:cell division protease FtsH
MSNDYSSDLNLIHDYKYFFIKENYNKILEDVIKNDVSRLYVSTDYKQIVEVDNKIQTDLVYNHFHIANIDPMVVSKVVDKSLEAHIPVYFVNFTPQSVQNIQHLFSDVFALVSNALPILIILSIVSSIIGNIAGSGGMNPLNMMKNNDNFVKPNVSLASWAGSPEVIDECKEVISYLENKEKYKEIGAEMPKGILLEGPPGTGKTLLAKAIATETNSTFISISGSAFVELFVGMGASRVRGLFESARKNKPTIIFIDEIDAVGKQRGVGLNTNDEREQTLNQLLYEMDGFNNNEDIVVMAATNRRDVLDQALLRPGRFDRIIAVPLPDKSSRKQILEYYLSIKKIQKTFDIESIAELTDGFSGAQLKSLINDAAIISAKNNYTMIQEQYIFDAFEKSVVGLIKKNSTSLETTKERVAIHETGHALLVLEFEEYFDLQKVSVQPTYSGAGGYTLFTEKPEFKDGLYTKDLFKKRLIVSMGGKAAESIYYGNDFVSLGAVQDLNQANSLAKKMIENFGMGAELEVFFYNEFSNKYSERTKYKMDKETLDLVKEAYIEAKTILKNNYVKMIDFSLLLQNSSVLYKNDIVIKK